MPPDPPDLASVAEVARAVFPRARRLHVERVTEGVSTFVFRVRRDDAAFYLRVLPAHEGSFSPEVLVHELLHRRNVKVPPVAHFEERNPLLGCSVMLVAEVPGAPLGHAADAGAMRPVLIEAGRDLALINGIPVEGFGWIKRDGQDNAGLQAEFATYREWIHRDVDEHIAFLASRGILPAGRRRAIEAIMRRYEHYFAVDRSALAHGDWDATHIYHQGGKYSGVIDFGEIRGANALYDLGHFRIENSPLLPAVLEGYRQVAPLPPDYLQRLHWSSLLVALRRLGRRVARRPAGWERDPDYIAIGPNIDALLHEKRDA